MIPELWQQVTLPDGRIGVIVAIMPEIPADGVPLRVRLSVDGMTDLWEWPWICEQAAIGAKVQAGRLTK